MQKKITNSQKAFTLVETLFAVAIFLLIVGVFTLFSKNIWIYNSFISDELTSTDNLRQVLKTMVSEIRTASVADTGAYAISQANSSSFTFYSNIDGDASKEKVRYFFTGTILQKGVTKPKGIPLAYNSVDEKTVVLTDSVTSTSIFSYYDENYDGTTAPLSSPVSIPAIRLIKISITTDKDVNRPPAPMTFSTEVSIRNLKDNL